MSEQYRDFDAELPVKKSPKLRFKLGGEEFSTLEHLHPSVFLVAGEERGTRGAVGFLQRTLDRDSRVLLDEMLADPDVEISDEQLDSVAAWVLRHLSGSAERPTQPSSPSGGGDGSTSNTSKESSPSPEPVSTG